MPGITASGGKKERFPRLILQLLISYLVIVTLGVGTFILPTQNTVSILREQTLTDQTAAVQRYARSADSVLSLFANMATSFLSDESTSTLAHGREIDPVPLYYRIQLLLTQYSAMYSNIFDHMYLYDSDSDNLLGVSGLASSADYYKGKLYASMSEETFARMLRQGHASQPDLFAQGQSAFVVHTLPFRHPDDRYILLIFSLPLQNFFETAPRDTHSPVQSGMYLTKPDVLLGNASGIGSLVTAHAKDLNTSSVQHVELEEAGTLFLIRSARNDRYYYFLMPLNVYNDQVAGFYQGQILALVAFLAISLIIVLFSLWQQYRPLKRLLDEIDNASIDGLSTRDYSMILSYLSNLKKERDEYKNLFLQRNPRLRPLLLTALLTDDKLDAQTIQASLRLLEIDFPHPFFAVLVMDILDDSELFFSQIDNPEDYSLFLIENVLRDLIPEDSKGVFFEMEGSLICLLNLRVEESPQAALRALQDQLHFAADFLARELNLIYRFATSSLHGSGDGFANAYAEALECGRSLHSHGPSVLLYDFLPTQEPTEFAYFQLYSGEQSRRLVGALRNGSIDKALDAIRLIFQEAGERRDLHPLLYKSMCRGMVCSFVEVLSEMGITAEGLERQLYDQLDVDPRAIAPKVMEERMLALCEQVAQRVHSASLDRQADTMAEINAYVQAHYADPNLGVTGIAEVFGMSVSSLSTFYGRHSEMGLCKHINRVRIQQAAHLLLEKPDMPLDEVAAQVGYSNTRSFSRVFSAELHCSPGKYRQGSGAPAFSGEQA